MSLPDVEDLSNVAADRAEVRRDFRQTLLSGVALTVPFFITVLILLWVLDLVSAALRPLVDLLFVIGQLEGLSVLIVEGIAAALVFGLIFAVGFVAQHGPDTHLGKRIDAVMEDVPGIGSIYLGVERMSGVLLDGNAESFQEVKLVEFPREGSYALAFLTAEAPSTIEDVAGHEDMVTVFVPLTPNPVTGGHLLHLPPERVHDVDLTVEEGMQAVMTTGIAIDDRLQDEAA